MKATLKAKKFITPEDLDGPMMVWPHTPLTATEHQAVTAWEAARKAAWQKKQSDDSHLSRSSK